MARHQANLRETIHPCEKAPISTGSIARDHRSKRDRKDWRSLRMPTISPPKAFLDAYLAAGSQWGKLFEKAEPPAPRPGDFTRDPPSVPKGEEIKAALADQTGLAESFRHTAEMYAAQALTNVGLGYAITRGSIDDRFYRTQFTPPNRAYENGKVS